MAIGDWRQLVTLDTTDGNGGIAPLTPAGWFCAVRNEGQGQVTLVGAYRPDITTATRVLYRGRIFHVTSVDNRDERNSDLILHGAEVFD